MHPKVKRMKKQLERAGGLVFLPDDIPDEVAERFMKEFLDCPDCRAAMAAARRHPPDGKDH